jgi:hypothetical protein
MPTRRLLIGGLTALATGSVLPARWSLARPAARPLDLANPADRLTAIAKLRGATDDRLVISYVIGARYAVPEHRLIPMMGILAATFSRWRRLDATRYEARSLEVAFFTDLATGAFLDRWTNPVTGMTVDVPVTRMGPSRLEITADGLTVDSPATRGGGLELRHVFQPPLVVGDEVWLTEQINVDGPPGPQPFIYNELSTYSARKSDLDDPRQAFVPTAVQYQSLITYRPWMGFGSTPGHTLARGAGRRVTRVADLPPAYLEFARRLHPDVIADPLAALAGPARA